MHYFPPSLTFHQSRHLTLPRTIYYLGCLDIHHHHARPHNPDPRHPRASRPGRHGVHGVPAECEGRAPGNQEHPARGEHAKRCLGDPQHDLRGGHRPRRPGLAGRMPHAVPGDAAGAGEAGDAGGRGHDDDGGPQRRARENPPDVVAVRQVRGGAGGAGTGCAEIP